MKKQYDLAKLRLKRRGPVAKPGTKVQKTIRIDLDVLAWMIWAARAAMFWMLPRAPRVDTLDTAPRGMQGILDRTAAS